MTESTQPADDTTEVEETEAPEAPVSHTARVHAWYVSSEGKETHVTRRDDGKWYINTTDAQDPAEYLAMDAIVDIFTLAHEEQRPHGTIPGLPDGERWDEAVAPLFDEPDDSDPEDE